MYRLLKLFLFIQIFFLIIQCKTKEEKTKELDEIRRICNKYEDEYKDYKYINNKLGLTLEFNNDWVINANYDEFDDFQKKYAKYFSSEFGEVLFVGFNKEKKIGIRCTCEELGLTNIKYLEINKSLSKKEITDYKIQFLEEVEEATFKNITATTLLFETKINPNNSFIFDSLLFNKDSFNYKIDLWTRSENFEIVQDYINSLINTIDFISIENIQKNDVTDDVENK